MRRASLFLLSVLALSCAKSPDAGMAGGGEAASASGPDAVLLRFPHGGGIARAYRWWSDTSVWNSIQRAPAVSEPLAFDAQQGVMVVLDAARIPVRTDLRLGRVVSATTERLRGITTADGYAVYGIAPTGEVVRLTSSGTWRLRPPAPVRTLVPLPDGALLMLSDTDDGRVALRKVHPPESKVVDSTIIAGADVVVPTTVGDRVYFASGDHLEGLRTRDLERSLTLTFSDAVRAVAPTPSGDRLFVAVRNDATLYVVDRYDSAVRDRITLPAPAVALRMDPDGRYLLARREAGDTADIVAVGTHRAIGAVETAWRTDLPFVAPDGALALAVNDALVVVDAETRRVRVRVPNGAADVWALVRWNGFRPRASSLDEPVTFEDAYGDTLGVDSVAPVPDPVPADIPANLGNAPSAPAPRAESSAHGWMVSFAAVLSESRARGIVSSLRVEGVSARVQSTERDGSMVYRVVAGPYATREAADEVGRRSGMPFWLFEAQP
ncbi:MAG: SPOR domain-containing protein [Gemmatimonadaceae bacterium]|nr:SPOR domain-containing protein [Gemmatimonadaceae bacterium]